MREAGTKPLRGPFCRTAAPPLPVGFFLCHCHCVSGALSGRRPLSCSDPLTVYFAPPPSPPVPSPSFRPVKSSLPFFSWPLFPPLLSLSSHLSCLPAAAPPFLIPYLLLPSSPNSCPFSIPSAASPLQTSRSDLGRKCVCESPRPTPKSGLRVGWPAVPACLGPRGLWSCRPFCIQTAEGSGQLGRVGDLTSASSAGNFVELSEGHRRDFLGRLPVLPLGEGHGGL